MDFEKGELYHIYNQGNNRQKIFFNRDNYPLQCFSYIHQNPFKAGLVKNGEDWEFSSAPDYAGIRDGSLIDKKVIRY